jgi:hypothetical protein
MEGWFYDFNRRHSVVFLILTIKDFYAIETQQEHSTITTLVWLHVSVFSRPSSDQYFPVEGTIDARCILWDPILITTHLALQYVRMS